MTTKKLSEIENKFDTSESVDEDLLDNADLLDPVALGYRGRGRPKLPIAQRRREKAITALTADELRTCMLAAANDESGPLKLQDWIRKVILQAADESAERMKK